MITPEQWKEIEKQCNELYDKLEIEIIQEISERIANVGYANTVALNDILVAEEMGILYEDAIELIAKYNNTSVSQIKEIFETAGVKSLKYDDNIYKLAGLSPKPLKQSKSMWQLLEATALKTHNNLTNLTMTTANTSQTQFYNAMNKAYLETSTGVKSYSQAIIDVIKDVSNQGAYIVYPSGRQMNIESAVRMNIITSVNQTCGKLQEMRADELGWDLMELTAHGGARPEHAEWQGKIVSRSGQKGYLSLDDIGYGKATGFKGVNCRHDWMPYYKGATRTYTNSELEKMANEKVTYDGQKISKYDASQIQRKMERQIRQDKKDIAGLEGILTSNTKDAKLIEDTKATLINTQNKLKIHNTTLNDFIEQTGFRKDYSRLAVRKTNTITRQAENTKKTIKSAKTFKLQKKQIEIPNNIEDFYKYVTNIKDREDFATTKSNENGYITGQRLNSILGYDKLPTKVSKVEFEKLVNETELGKLYRGISADTIEKCQEYVDKFKNGTFYSGGQAGHIYGKGTYTGFGDLGKNTAYNYASQTQNGQVIEMLLDKDAKTINYNDLYKETNKEVDEFIKRHYQKYNIDNYIKLVTNLNKIQECDEFMTKYILNVAHDVGYNASIKGYDAIIANNELAGQKYAVILNRGKVIISE